MEVIWHKLRALPEWKEGHQVKFVVSILEQPHQLVEKIPSILHKKPTFSILHRYFYKTPTSVYLFYKTIQ